MLKEFWTILKQTFTEWNQDEVPRYAAALAFYTALSVAPLLVVIVAIVGAVYGQAAAQGQIVGQIQSVVGEEGASVVQDMIANAYQAGDNWISTIISIVVLLFGATGLFGQLQKTLNDIWNVEPPKNNPILSVVRQKLLSFGMILIIGFLLLVSLVLSAVISSLHLWLTNLFPAAQVFFQVLSFLVNFGVTTLLFALIYKFLPEAQIEWRDVGVGAVVTSLLFSIGRTVLGLYLGGGSTTSVYGAAGSLMVILLWVYYSAQIILFGAEFTQVYARRYGSRILSQGIDRKALEKEEKIAEHSHHETLNTPEGLSATPPT